MTDRRREDYRMEFCPAERKYKWRVLSFENWAGDDAKRFKTREQAQEYLDNIEKPRPWEWRAVE